MCAVKLTSIHISHSLVQSVWPLDAEATERERENDVYCSPSRSLCPRAKFQTLNIMISQVSNTYATQLMRFYF